MKLKSSKSVALVLTTFVAAGGCAEPSPDASTESVTDEIAVGPRNGACPRFWAPRGAAASAADQAGQTSIDEAIVAHAASSEAVGLSYAIQTLDGRFFSGGTGVRDIATQAPMDACTRVHVASTSKALTATVIAAQIAQRRVPQGLLGRTIESLDVPTAARLATVEGPASDAFSTMTFENLLTHTSGLSIDYLPEGYPSQRIKPWTAISEWSKGSFPSSNELAGARIELLLPPGQQVKYSNVAVVEAANIVADYLRRRGHRGRTEEIFDRELTRTLFEPLFMTSTSARLRDDVGSGHPLATYYSARKPGAPAELDSRYVVPSAVDGGGYSPAFGVVSNAADMTRFMAYLARLTHGTQRAAFAPARMRATLLDFMRVRASDSASRLRGVGYLLFVDTENDDILVGHTGFYETASAASAFSLKHGYSVTLLSNNDSVFSSTLLKISRLAATFAAAPNHSAPSDVQSLIASNLDYAANFVAPVVEEPVPTPVRAVEPPPAEFAGWVGTYTSDVSANFEIFWAEGATAEAPILGFQYEIDDEPVALRMERTSDGWSVRLPYVGQTYRREPIELRTDASGRVVGAWVGINTFTKAH